MSDNVFGVTPAVETDQGVTPSPVEPAQPEDTQELAPPEPAKPVGSEADEDAFEGVSVGDLVKLGTRAYGSIEQADRVFKQFAGRVRAELERRRSAESERDRIAGALETFRTLSQQPQTQQEDKGTPATPPPPPAPKRLTDLVSDEEFDGLVAEHGPAKAFRRLAELTESRLAEALEEQTRDIRPIVQRTHAAERTAETFDGCAALKDEQGRPLYPEIGDPNAPAAQQVFEIWQRNFSDPALAPLAFTQHGIRMAVLEYRAANGQPASSRPRTPAGAAVTARRSADRVLQSMGTGGAAGPRPGGPGSVGDDEERIRAAIRATQHPIFGVTMRSAA